MSFSGDWVIVNCSLATTTGWTAVLLVMLTYHCRWCCRNVLPRWILFSTVQVCTLSVQQCLLHFAWVVDDAECIVVTRVCVYLSVCLTAPVCPHYCTDPGVTWGSGRGCPLVVQYWVDLQLVHGLCCYGNITRTLVTSLRPSRDMTT